MFKVLDLFAGVGGTAKGIQTFLQEKNIPFQYVAVENDPETIKAHLKLNPDSEIEFRDAYLTSIKDYDFIWASPPCTSHSQLNMYMNRKQPDMRLWSLITRLQQQQIPFIVENVEPYYREPIPHTLELGRHRFWSNKPIIPFEVPKMPKDWGWMGIPDWEKFHEINTRVTKFIKDPLKRRQLLRNIVHWTISYRIIEQILFPKQKQLEVVS
ncbi:MAG: DNA cytosine methyltransferase [Candidatus Heimdallarchaeota archaeon]|nr:DNA cytosine methyltransferase [Candidatus Heimdallarchaeota archaeon]